MNLVVLGGKKEKTAGERRNKENEDIIARMRAGCSHSLISPQATWWPPRPIIEKDKDAVKRLYRHDDDKKD